ncbi:M14 family zinc carboxypeptidase [Collimonas sp.]|jgi:murein tripeptide amidase MpaA|uniref:M14 family zinc carboxypeptidase n=1 Tax=Collimonas sp. TaxID=1963772 RepID=UPI002CC84350|nr:M14 family zinc carboxypeptidase [Collimonas sp.]HWW04046.1 M14 family zinc carboxypeptidase [Collimonas sp.]
MLRSAVLSALLTLSATPFVNAAADPLSTVAERSGFQQTGRYEEVIALCAAFQKAYPKQVRCTEFGRTPEGRPMLALIVSRSGALSAEAAHKRGLPVLLIQGGIHAGEIDGKDAGFQALREALQDTAANSPLNQQVLVFVPVFNIDGHERFGRWNRPNQRGPESMGWRTTGQNFNLNRDYAKADAPEMQAMLQLVNRWDPLAYIDLHVTDGAKFEHDVSIQVEPVHASDLAMRKDGEALRDNVISDLARQGSLPLPFYLSFKTEDDPSSGFVDDVSPPRFSTGYFHLRNRFGMLVETHSWKDYPTRVRITHNTIVSVMAQIAAHGSDWLKTAQQADLRAAQLGGQAVALSYKASDKTRPVAFRGYEYTRTPSDISGALMTRYDESKPQIWNVTVRDDLQPDLSVNAPQAGYLVPAAHAAWIAQKLQQHGIAFRVLPTALHQAALETFRATKTSFDPQSLESHQSLKLQGAWHSETRDLGAGALFVPIAQAKARLVMALLEPLAPDSLAAWGRFNNAFEKKEYMEAYVAEDVAREQLAADPALAAEFRTKLAADPEFAKDPAARLEFFARRHTSWDERYNLYPVMRTAVVPG